MKNKVMGLCIILVILSFYACGEDLVDSYKLISLHNEKNIEGSFFLGCGSIGETEYYFGFVETNDDSLRLKRLQIPCSYTDIIEDNTKIPHLIIRYSSLYTHPKIGELCKEGLYDFTLIVPDGTIIRNFKLK